MLIDAFIFPEQSSAFMKCNIIIIKNAHLLKLNVVNEFGKKLQGRVKKIIFAEDKSLRKGNTKEWF